MASGNFWAAIGGAFGAASDVLNEQRKQREMQAYQEKLRKQELEDFQKKEQIRAEIERKNRAGESRQILQSPTGEIINVGYDDEGRGLLASPIGTVPGVKEALERQMEAEAIKERREQEKHESALSRDASTRYRNNEAALTSRARRENPEMFRSSGGGRAPNTTPSVTDKSNARRLAESEVKAEMGVDQVPKSRREEFNRLVSQRQQQILVGAGKRVGTRDNPYPVASEDEIDSLPIGTTFILNGRIGIVE
jgi:hypothetical protein